MKTRTLLLTFILLLFMKQFVAQDNIHLFAEEGTVWSVGAFTTPYQLTNLDYLLLQGTTQEDEFDDDYYHIIRIGESYPPTIENTSVALYAKVLEDSILYVKLPDGEPYPIFDYKLGEGDETDLNVFDFYTQTFTAVAIQVQSIENINTLSGIRKKWNIVGLGETYWIEGLGNKEGLIYANYGLYCFIGAEYFMICAFNGEDHLYQNSLFGNCYLTDVEDNNVSDELLLTYPNPVKDVLHVESDLLITKLELFDCTGKIVLEKLVNSNMARIDLSKFENGIYYLKVNSDKGIIQKSIVKI